MTLLTDNQKASYPIVLQSSPVNANRTFANRHMLILIRMSIGIPIHIIYFVYTFTFLSLPYVHQQFPGRIYSDNILVHNYTCVVPISPVTDITIYASLPYYDGYR